MSNILYMMNPWKLFIFVMTAYMFAMIAVGILYERFFPAAIGLCVTVPAVYYFGKKAKTADPAILDEMTLKVAADSALWTYRIMIPLIAAAAIIFILGSDRFGDWAKPVGYAMYWTLIMFMALYVTISFYKTRKLRNEE